jgi:hypothetical protein
MKKYELLQCKISRVEKDKLDLNTNFEMRECRLVVRMFSKLEAIELTRFLIVPKSGGKVRDWKYNLHRQHEASARATAVTIKLSIPSLYSLRIVQYTILEELSLPRPFYWDEASYLCA